MLYSMKFQTATAVLRNISDTHLSVCFLLSPVLRRIRPKITPDLFNFCLDNDHGEDYNLPVKKVE